MSSARRRDDGFTPRQFPLDPFEDAGRTPWTHDAAALPSVGELAAQRTTVLVLGGEPPRSVRGAC